jgi:hypothetical protein
VGKLQPEKGGMISAVIIGIAVVVVVAGFIVLSRKPSDGGEGDGSDYGGWSRYDGEL